VRSILTRLLTWLLREPQINYRHLHGSKRIYLHGDGIEAGWYRLEERREKVTP
jgi:hypothetical protein